MVKHNLCSSPSVYTGTPDPLPNELLSLLFVASTLATVGYMVFRIQRDGMTAFRRSSLFLVLAQLAAAAYYAAYSRWL